MGYHPIMTLTLDTLDHRILTLLQRDATLSMDALSDAVALSRNACWRRIKRMEDSGVIAARVALLDPERLGVGLQVFVMIQTADHSPDWLARFQKAVQTLPEIQSAHRMSGDLDYILRVRVSDMRGYDRFYRHLIDRVPLAKVSASFEMEALKDTTALPLPGA